MYPSRFHYEAPRSLDEAFGVLQTYGDEAKIPPEAKASYPSSNCASPRRRALSISIIFRDSNTTKRTPTDR